MGLILLIAIIGLPLWAQSNITNVIRKYSRVRVQNGMTGAEVAQYILHTEGIYDVEVKPIGGQLTDNYNPRDNTVNLSSAVYQGNSIASVCIAAHEVGHAIQHHEKYRALNTRNAIFPFARTGGQLASISILIGFIAQLPGLITFGIICLVAILAFQLATLPVEYNASTRALSKLEQFGLLSTSELAGGKEVLKAAALTYLMAAISTFLNIIRLIGISNND